MPALRRLLLLALCGFCFPATHSAPASAQVTTGHTVATVAVETVVRGLENPWSLAFLPDGRMLATERPGRLRLASREGRLSPPLSGVPRVVAGGQAGLFDVVLDPAFGENRRVYLSYAEGGEGNRNGLAVARGTLAPDGNALQDVTVIFRQQPKVDSNGHFGGRLVFARDGTLFVTLGDRQSRRERGKAQHPDKHHGKVVRIDTEGRVPADNPFAQGAAFVQGSPQAQRPGTLPQIWSLGHRNPQGAAIHPRTGELWVSEHGPQGGDEINIVRAGKNYGWPVITHGCEYGTCFKVGEGTHKTGMEQPVTFWVPKSIAPSGLAFYTGDRYPGWKGNLFSGALAGQALWRLVLRGNEIVEREALLTSLGERIRDVRQGPDGYLYLLTDNPNGRVLRVVLR